VLIPREESNAMKRAITDSAVVLRKAWDEVSASFDRFCLAAGIEALGTMMEKDAEEACGPRHGRGSGRRGHRWGRTQGKASKPTEFGKMVKLQEAENQIITDYEVYAQRPSDSDLLIPAIDTHQALLGRVPRLVAADAAFYSARNEAAAKAKGVKRVCIPNRSTKSLERKREQKKRWFRNGQKWRTGCEGRISVIKRRHGLSRCRYKGVVGMDRWVGFGVIADNLINIGRAMEQAAEP
jgi:hypothetical protein